MKATLKKADLKDALINMNKAINTGATKPVLNLVKISSGLTGLYLTATDLEIYIRQKLGRLDFDGVIECLVDGKQFAQAVKSAPGKEIDLELNGKVLKIAGAIELDASWDLDEYPLEPNGEWLDPIWIDGEEFATQVKRTLFAAAKDMSCYAYNGLLFEAKGKLIATDGRRLAISKCPISSAAWEAVLVKKGLDLAARAYKKDHEVGVTRANTSVGRPVIRFEGKEGVTLYVRQLEGDFPKYRDAVPEKISKRVLIHRETFQPAIEQAVALNKEREVHELDLIFDEDGKLRLQTTVDGVGSMDVEVEALGGPKDFRICLNPDFVLDWLKSLEKVGALSSVHTMGRVHGTVELGLQAEKAGQKRGTKAMTFQDADDLDQTYILMPITEK